MNEAFMEVVGANGKVDRDEAVYDPPPGYEEEERNRIIPASAIFDDVERMMVECTKYCVRETEWQRVWGTID